MDINELRKLAGLPPLAATTESKISELEEEFDTGYTEEEHDADDFFPNGADAPVGKKAGPASATSGDNPMQKGIKEGSETLREGRRLVFKTDGESDFAKVYYDSEWQEYVVKFYEGGKYNPEADYFTDDKDDAIGTANHSAVNTTVTDDDIDYINNNAKNYEGETYDDWVAKNGEPDDKLLDDAHPLSSHDPYIPGEEGDKYDPELSHNYYDDDEYSDDALSQPGNQSFDEFDDELGGYAAGNPEDFIDDLRGLGDKVDSDNRSEYYDLDDYLRKSAMKNPWHFIRKFTKGEMSEAQSIHESLVRQYRKFLKD